MDRSEQILAISDALHDCLDAGVQTLDAFQVGTVVREAAEFVVEERAAVVAHLQAIPGFDPTVIARLEAGVHRIGHNE